MCGRYRLSRRKQLIEEYFETDNEVEWEPRYNIAPSQPVGIIRQGTSTSERRFSLARWGLIPSWATDASIGFKTINARAETAAITLPHETLHSAINMAVSGRPLSSYARVPKHPDPASRISACQPLLEPTPHG